MRLRRLLPVVAGLVVLGLPAGASAAGTCPNEALREEQGTTGLPDCRAYEQVSPVGKDGADVIPNESRVHASVDGSRVIFATLTGFGDVRGSAGASEYMAARNAGGGEWDTHAISPQQDALGYFGIFHAIEPVYTAVSGDLSRGVLSTRTPLTDAPNVVGVVNLYLRDDLLSAGAGSYRLLTDAVSPQPTSNFVTGYLSPFVIGTSADFSHVLFESRRSLTLDVPVCSEAEPERNCPPLLYESVDGAMRLVGVLPASEGGGSAPASRAKQGAHALSQDGSRAVFTVPTSNVATDGALYLRDDHGTLGTGDDTTVRVDASESATPLSGPSEFWAASADASMVFFINGGQLYRYDLNAPADSHLTLISVDSEPTDGTGVVEGVIGASADGSYVYFSVLQNQLVAGGPTGNAGGPVGDTRIFVWHSGSVREVGAVNGGAEIEGILGRGGTATTARVSPDGTHLVFLTEGTEELLSLYGHPEYDHGTCANFTGPDCSEVYVYDATAGGGAGDLLCASCNPTGMRATADASFEGAGEGLGHSALTPYLNHLLSGDGRFVFFNTNERLLPGDHNDVSDVYEYDTSTHEVHLLSDGRGGSASLFLDASPDGHDVFIGTRERLLPRDRDQSRDLYDVRIGGGFSEPAAVAGCDGEACRGAVGAAPGVPSAASEVFSGEGNLSGVSGVPGKAKPVVRAVRCKRGFTRRVVKGRARCVKQKKRRVAKRAGRASGRGK